MFKFLLLAILAQVTFVLYTKPMSLSPDYTAMVKYNQVVYHCQDVVKTNCGHTIRCDDMSVHCANDLVIEYI